MSPTTTITVRVPGRPDESYLFVHAHEALRNRRPPIRHGPFEPAGAKLLPGILALLVVLLTFHIVAGRYEVVVPGPVHEAATLAGATTSDALLVTTVRYRRASALDLVRSLLGSDQQLARRSSPSPLPAVANADLNFDLSRQHASLAAIRCVGTDEARSAIEVSSPGTVGGASAGLLMALAHVEALRGHTLPDGTAVAGTGVIDPHGGVHEIEHVGEKALAALAAGADVFLAPATVAADAQRAAPDLRVVGVGSLDEALSVLGAPGCDSSSDSRTQTFG